jgi:4-hydroxyphenylpyruvate dioxygenase
MDIDHVHFYVEDAHHWRDWLSRYLNFTPVAVQRTQDTHTEVLQHGQTAMLFSAAITPASPVAQFLNQHPAGVADVAFRVADLGQQLQSAQAHAAQMTQPLTVHTHEQGGLHIAQIQGWGGLCHTLVQRCGQTPWLPGLPLTCSSASASALPVSEPRFTGIDHIVLNVAAADLEPAICWYEKTLGFQRDRPFEIQTPRSGLRSQVLVHPDGQAQLPINAPSTDNSQIQEFLNYNRGSGVQHLALRTENLMIATQKLMQRGLAFLKTPASYYQHLREQLHQYFPQGGSSLTPDEVSQLQQHHILADWRGQPQSSILLQIFSQPIFGQPTFFLEFIERRHQAQGFGEGNFLALFEAMEREQLQRQPPAKITG